MVGAVGAVTGRAVVAGAAVAGVTGTVDTVLTVVGCTVLAEVGALGADDTLFGVRARVTRDGVGPDELPDAVAQAAVTRIPPTNMVAVLATDARSTRCMVNCRFLGCRPR